MSHPHSWLRPWGQLAHFIKQIRLQSQPDMPTLFPHLKNVWNFTGMKILSQQKAYNKCCYDANINGPKCFSLFNQCQKCVCFTWYFTPDLQTFCKDVFVIFPTFCNLFLKAEKLICSLCLQSNLWRTMYRYSCTHFENAE